MVCFRYVTVNTLHDGDNKDNNNKLSGPLGNPNYRAPDCRRTTVSTFVSYALLCLWQIVDSLSPRRRNFNTRRFHVAFVVKKSDTAIGFPPSTLVSFLSVIPPVLQPHLSLSGWLVLLFNWLAKELDRWLGRQSYLYRRLINLVVRLKD